MNPEASSPLTDSAQDYLEAILVLGQEKRVVRVKDIAHHLKVNMSSVVAMNGRLADQGLVQHEAYGHVELTERGERRARGIYRRHQILFDFLHHLLGVDHAIAQEDACRIEHHLHPQTLEHIVKFIRFVEQCPDGHPLWLTSMHRYIREGVVRPPCPHREHHQEETHAHVDSESTPGGGKG